jgi:hypothetical protein
MIQWSHQFDPTRWDTGSFRSLTIPRWLGGERTVQFIMRHPWLLWPLLWLS